VAKRASSRPSDKSNLWMGIDGRSEHREARENNPYAQVLSDYGVDFEIAAPWLRVLRTRRIGGWKLHLSGRPSTAIDLLHRTLPILSAHKVAFKLASDPEILMGLNEGSFGDTQVGKFMTIYPRVGGHAAEIARQLIDVTAGLSGPVVLTDLRIGDVVYARYGSFRPIIEQDRLGQDRIFIRTARGRDIPDRYEIPFRLPAGTGLPAWLNAMADPYRVKSTSSKHRLLGGFRPYQIIANNSKGAVMLALDLRRQESVSLCVLKQGRAHCLEDLSNRDIRQRLRHQAELGLELSQVIRTPRPGQYFEVGDSGYLPLERIVGQTLLTFVTAGPSAGMWEDLTGARREVLIHILRDVACQLSEMHARGIVHRDLSPRNVIISEGDDAWILDLELSHRINDPSPAFGKGTPGYMSPESDERARPAPEQDVYSFGCLMLFVFTGADPRASLRSDGSATRNRTGSLRRVQPQLVQLMRDCLCNDPARRPTMRHIASQLNDSRLWILQGSRRVPPPSRLEALIAAGVLSLVRDAPRTSEGVWVSPLGTPDATSGSFADYGVCRDAHHGVAGVVYLLSRLLRAGLLQKADVEPAIRTGLKWLADSDTNRLPGLYFGEAGVALACHEADLVGIGPSMSTLSRSLDVVRTAPIDWWDVTHGAAGQGLAILQLSREDVIENRAFIEKLCSRLLESQLPDGSWVVPPGVDGLSGDTLTGFAHGCAGVVFFLTAAFRFLGDEQALAAAINGANWLLSCADRSSRGILRWPYSLRNPEQWSWWCHGSPGISLAFLQLAIVTADARFADAATLALGGLTQEIRPTNLSLCHGLSGLGETYLEAYEALGDRRWLTAAEQIVRVVASTYHELPGDGVSWTVEDPYTTTADLMVGAGSVLHFMARFVSPASGLGFAMLPPIAPPAQPIG
jgi:hypothetical protein